MTDRTPVIVGAGITPFSSNHEAASARDLTVEAVLACTVTPERQVANAKRGLTDTHAAIGTICVVNIFERED